MKQVHAITIPDHGEYEFTADQMNRALEAHLPASPAKLRRKIQELTGEGCEGHPAEDCGTPHAGIGDVAYCDGSCVTTYRGLGLFECLVILADLTQ